MAHLQTVEIINVLQIVARDANLKVAMMESIQGAGVVGSSAFVGGLIGGRLGIALGGLIGSALALAISDDFKSVPEIIAEMTPKQQDQLVQSVRPFIQQAGVASSSALLAFILSRDSVRDNIIDTINTFFRDVMKMSIQS